MNETTETGNWIISAIIIAIQIVNLVTVVSVLTMMRNETEPRTYSTEVPTSIQEVRKNIWDAEVNQCVDQREPRPAPGTGCEMRVERPLTWL